MAKIGARGYPADVEPEEAREYIEILVNEFGGKAGSEEAFAQAIGHSTTTSGSYLRKRGDLRKYGLMKPRSIEATELGYDAANPRDDEEEKKILFEMLENISILLDIYEAVNGTEPDEMWRVLTELTEANPKEAQKAEANIGNLYAKLLEYEPEDEDIPEDSQSGEPVTEPEVEEQRRDSFEDSDNVVRPESGIFVKVGNDEIKLERITESNLDLAKQFLESKKGSRTDSVQMRFG